MEYSQVILEMLERIKSLESKVKSLEESLGGTANVVAMEESFAGATAARQHAVPLANKVSAKYRGLAEYLLSSDEDRVTLSYSQIEKILGFRLPDTARKHKQAYWANSETHSYSSAWLAVGYRTRVDPDSDAVTFIKNLV